MKEISQILQAYKKIDFSVQKVALATVVQVEGSSYRRAGARMLITDDGKLTGAISGGCLEGDALRKALKVMHQGQAMVVTYDTTDEDDAKLGIGLGCNGVIHILIQPISPDNPNNPLELLLKAKSDRQKAGIAILYSLKDKKMPQTGETSLYAGGNSISTITDSAVEQEIQTAIVTAYENNQSSIEYVAQAQLNGFVEVLQPTIRLVVFGAGNDVIPLTEMAGVLGWETIVIDGRATHAKPERFPAADQVITAKPQEGWRLIKPDAQTYFLLMTHNYNYDLEIFRNLITLDVSYIGVLGPKKKLERMIAEAGVSGSLPNVYGPVGLDIGAEAAEEIALSILSEIKAISTGRLGGPLRDKEQPIHSSTNVFSSISY